MREELLRGQNDLIVSGQGAVVLGVWTTVKVFLLAIMQRNYAAVLTRGIPRPLFLILYYLLASLILAAFLTLRVYVGRSAMAEGRGEKRGNAYLALAGLLTVLNLIGIVCNALVMLHSSRVVPRTAAMLIVDVTVVCTLVDLIRTAVRVRRLRGELEEGGVSCG